MMSIFEGTTVYAVAADGIILGNIPMAGVRARVSFTALLS